MLKKEIFHILFLIIFSGFLFFYKLGNLPLLDPDESRYAEVSREMMETKIFSLPYFNYELRLNKPPLYYWLVFLSYSVWGVNEFAARFPSAISALGGVLITYFLGYKLYVSPLIGFLAALILATSWEFLIIARLAIIDMVLCFFVLATIFFFIKFQKNRKRIYVYGLWISMAFSFLTKGPVGLIPILIFLIYALIDKKMSLFKEIFYMPALLIFLVISLSWYCLVLMKLGFKEGMTLFRQETVERFVSGYIHREHFLYFLPIILAGFLPWSIFLPWIRLKSRDKFVVSWVIVIVLFFSLSKSKVATYILAVFPALGLIIANFWQEAFLNQIRKIKLKMFLSMFSFLLIITFSFLWAKNFVVEQYEINLSQRISYVFIIPAVIILIISIYSTFKGNVKALFFSLIFFTVSAVFLFYRMFASDLGNTRSTKALIQPIEDKIRPQDSVVAYNFKRPSLIFYLRHKIIFLKDFLSFLEYLNKGENRLFLILKRTDYDDLKGRYNFQVENEEQGYLIVSRNRKE